jgi:response regulator RpfG family c-di-GMP phosphodiesterase
LVCFNIIKGEINILKDRVLIVDDVVPNLYILESQLLPLGYDVIKAYNGKEALEKLAKDDNINLVILDIMMPVMDGYETCSQIKSNPKTANIPVIFVTAVTGVKARLKCIEVGGDDFLNKPINKLELLARTKSLVNKKKAQDKLDFSYKNITKIIDFTDRNLNIYNPLEFDFGRFNDDLVINILKNIDEEEDKKPQYLLLTSRMDRNLSGHLFYKKGGILIRIPERIIIDFHSDLTPTLSMAKCIMEESVHEGSELVYSNWYDYGKDIQEYQKIFNEKIKDYIGEIRNFVTYYSGQIAVIAFNYGKSVNEFDAQILKGFVIHSNFFRTISNQARINEDAFLYTVEALARAAEASDEDTYSHIIRVNEYAKTIALELNCPDRFVRDINHFAQMHDVGKIHVERKILQKPGKLTAKEFEDVKMHTVYGVKILGDSPRLAMASDIAISHHEKFKGGGYPYSKKGKDIPLSGLIRIADVYDALRTKRCYKPALPHSKVYKIITEGDGRTMPEDFAPEVLDAFKKNEKRFKEIYTTIQDDKINRGKT